MLESLFELLPELLLELLRLEEPEFTLSLRLVDVPEGLVFVPEGFVFVPEGLVLVPEFDSLVLLLVPVGRLPVVVLLPEFTLSLRLVVVLGALVDELLLLPEFTVPFG